MVQASEGLRLSAHVVIHETIRRVPHALNDDQKAKRVRYAEAMITSLDEQDEQDFNVASQETSRG
jgi:hypothetical protein